jgi:hypothetical protein
MPVDPVPNRPLTTRLRTSLYLANDAINGRRLVRGLFQTPGLEDQVPPEIRETIEQHATEWEREIGEEWAARIMNARGYAGVSVQHLAESLGFAQLYPSVAHVSEAGLTVNVSRSNRSCAHKTIFCHAADHLQEGVLDQVGVAGVVEDVGEGPGEFDVLVELADGEQPGVAGELARRRLDDERRADKL